MTAPRLLLVEFLNRDRFCQYRSDLFPFVSGWARTHDIPIRWLAFGFDPDQLPGGPFHMTLPAPEKRRLLSEIEEFRPTHALSNEQLEDTLAASVGTALGDTRLDVYSLDGGPTFERVGALRGWLGLPDVVPEGPSAPRGPGNPPRLRDQPDPYLVDSATPHYGCELIGEAAHEVKPFVFAVGGPHCFYARPLARNRFFTGVDLAESHRTVGCTFCGESAEGRYPYSTPPVELTLRQLRAARETCPPARNAGEFAVWGSAVVMRMHRLFGALLEENAPPTHLFFALRIDELNRKAHHLDEWLPRLAAAGHSIRIYNMGVENFSEPENERLNKGVSVADVRQAVANLDRWERLYPETLGFRRYGAFGFILFTPWTTLTDLRTNVLHAREFGLKPDAVCPSRVLLMPGRPLALLARHDGLIVDRDDANLLAAFDSGSFTSAEDSELPWRFQNAATQPVYELFQRLRAPETIPADDPYVGRLDEVLLRLPSADGALWDLAELILAEADEAAADHPSDATTQLLARVEARVRRDHPLPRPGSRPSRSPLRAEPPALAAERDRLAHHIQEAARLLAAHPKRLLLGFQLAALSGERGYGWGELKLTLTRGDDTLTLFFSPLSAAPHAFLRGTRFAVSHAEETPLDTPDRRRAAETLLRGAERYIRGREKAGVP